MSSPLPQPAPPILASAEQILTVALGGPVRLGAATPFPDRDTIFRVLVLDGPADAPTSVVVKAATPRDDASWDAEATDWRSLAWRLFNDWAGLQFLQELGLSSVLTPRFYGGDRPLGFFVVEDLGDGQGLDHLLLGDDPRTAEQALLALAAAVGHMQARTAGPEAQAAYTRLRDGLGPPRLDQQVPYSWLAKVVEDTGRTLDVALPLGTVDDLAALTRTFRDPGPFLTYLHHDVCPGNCLMTAGGVKLLDFEFGRFGHALLDGVYIQGHFPTCSINRLPPDLLPRMEALYRTALVPGCPAAGDDRLFYAGVVEACAHWAIMVCSWYPDAALQDQPVSPGEATVRQLILLPLEIAARLASEHAHLEALGQAFSLFHAALRARWPDTVELALYPAFRT